MKVVVVESPSKAKTINKYLGPGYEVLASFGHIRDLPAKDGSVDPDNNFKMLWEVDPQSQKRVNDIAHALKGADTLILATDPDREGEAISWHVLEALNEKKALKGQKVERVVFNAITKQSVTEAMKHPRAIDEALVDAYLARRALDYLVGFTLSPVLWRKLPGARSAGRVQSVALRLVCDRELEIEKFIAKEYWSIAATLATPRGESFEARLVGADGQKLQRLDIGTGVQAQDLKQALETATQAVESALAACDFDPRELEKCEERLFALRGIVPTSCEAVVQLILGDFQAALERGDTGQVRFVLQLLELLAPLHLLHEEFGVVHRDLQRQLATAHGEQVARTLGRTLEGLVGLVEAGGLLQGQALLTLGSVGKAVRVHTARQFSIARGQLFEIQRKARLQLE